MKILVFGPNGWIGSKLVDYLNAEPSPVRIESYKNVLNEIRRVKPDVVINAAGKTHGKNCGNIDGCLDEREETIESNIFVPGAISQACEKVSCHFVHLSSGCIFNGYPQTRPNGFIETDLPNPVSFYAETKVDGEMVSEQYKLSTILRFRMPFDGSRNKRNLIIKLKNNIKNGYIIDTPNSMTCVDDLIKVIRELINLRATGTFHIVNPGPLRHSTILGWMCVHGIVTPELLAKIEFVSPEQFKNLKITRDGRSNCILDSSKLEKTIGFKLRDSKEAMEICFERMRP